MPLQQPPTLFQVTMILGPGIGSSHVESLLKSCGLPLQDCRLIKTVPTLTLMLNGDEAQTYLFERLPDEKSVQINITAAALNASGKKSTLTALNVSQGDQLASTQGVIILLDVATLTPQNLASAELAFNLLDEQLPEGRSVKNLVVLGIEDAKVTSSSEPQVKSLAQEKIKATKEALHQLSRNLGAIGYQIVAPNIQLGGRTVFDMLSTALSTPTLPKRIFSLPSGVELGQVVVLTPPNRELKPLNEKRIALETLLMDYFTRVVLGGKASKNLDHLVKFSDPRVAPGTTWLESVGRNHACTEAGVCSAEARFARTQAKYEINLLHQPLNWATIMSYGQPPADCASIFAPKLLDFLEEPELPKEMRDKLNSKVAEQARAAKQARAAEQAKWRAQPRVYLLWLPTPFAKTKEPAFSELFDWFKIALHTIIAFNRFNSAYKIPFAIVVPLVKDPSLPAEVAIVAQQLVNELTTYASRWGIPLFFLGGGDAPYNWQPEKHIEYVPGLPAISQRQKLLDAALSQLVRARPEFKRFANGNPDTCVLEQPAPLGFFGRLMADIFGSSYSSSSVLAPAWPIVDEAKLLQILEDVGKLEQTLAKELEKLTSTAAQPITVTQSDELLEESPSTPNALRIHMPFESRSPLRGAGAQSLARRPGAQSGTQSPAPDFSRHSPQASTSSLFSDAHKQRPPSKEELPPAYEPSRLLPMHQPSAPPPPGIRHGQAQVLIFPPVPASAPLAVVSDQRSWQQGWDAAVGDIAAGNFAKLRDLAIGDQMPRFMSGYFDYLLSLQRIPTKKPIIDKILQTSAATLAPAVLGALKGSGLGNEIELPASASPGERRVYTVGLTLATEAAANLPIWFKCALTNELMMDPVKINKFQEGWVYDRAALRQQLERNRLLHPITGASLVNVGSKLSNTHRDWVNKGGTGNFVSMVLTSSTWKNGDVLKDLTTTDNALLMQMLHWIVNRCTNITDDKMIEEAAFFDQLDAWCKYHQTRNTFGDMTEFTQLIERMSIFEELKARAAIEAQHAESFAL